MRESVPPMNAGQYVVGSRCGPAPRPFMFVPYSVEFDASTVPPLGYHAVGSRPATWSGADPVASRTTAMSSSPPFVTYRVDPSDDAVIPSGLAPTGADGYGRRSIVRRTLPVVAFRTLTLSESPFAT